MHAARRSHIFLIYDHHDHLVNKYDHCVNWDNCYIH
jgi:hypothetical protein